MRISARNQLPGTVVSIEKGAVNGVVKIEVAPGVIITSSITNAAIGELELAEGKQAVDAATKRRSAPPSVRPWWGWLPARNLLNLPPGRRHGG